MDKAELKKLFMNMYAGKTSAWDSISKNFKRVDLDGKKATKRTAMSNPAFQRLIDANTKAVKSNQNKQEWNVKPKSIRMNGKTFGEVERQKHYEKIRDTGVVDSEAVENIRYDPAKKNLDVRFVNGEKEYRYPEVPQRVAQAFIASPSKGAFVQNVLGNYSDISHPEVQKKIAEERS